MDFGPLAKMLMGNGPVTLPAAAQPQAGQADVQKPGMLQWLQEKARGVPVVDALVNRPATVDAAVNGAPAPAAPGPRPAQLTPEQQSDLYQVGAGRMKVQDFVAKHGFLPQ